MLEHMSRILITGGAGFIGSQLGYAYVAEGHDVILLDNMSYGYLDNLMIEGQTFGQFVGLDVRSPALAKQMDGVDFVYHFAGLSALPVCQAEPAYAIDVNVGGTANVLECARLAGVQRVIFASTSAIYENNTQFPCSESDPVAPTLTYSVSKLQAEKLCSAYWQLYDLPVVTLRYFNVYGPHQDFRRTSPPLMSYILRELLNGRPPVLHSDGTQERDCVYVEDVNRLNALCMTHPKAPGEVINVGSGVATSVRDIYRLLAESCATELEPVYQPAHGFWNAFPMLFEGQYPLRQEVVEQEVVKYTLADTTRAQELLGWSPSVGIDEGLKRTAQYALKLHNDTGS